MRRGVADGSTGKLTVRIATDERRAGLGLAAAGAIAFGTLAIFAKSAYEVGAEPIPLLAVRFVVAALLLVAFLRITGRSLAIGRRNALRLMGLGACGYAFEASLFFAALERAPASIVGLIFYSYPLWTALTGLVLGIEPFRKSLFGALALGSAGILLIFSIPETTLEGPLLALAASIAVTAYFVTAQFFVKGIDPVAAATFTAIGAGLALTLVSAITGKGLPAAALPPALGLGAVTAIAFAFLYAAVARMGSAHTGVAMMLEPVTTIVLAALFLDETITLRVLVGAALVVSALPILAVTKHPGEAELPAADSI